MAKYLVETYYTCTFKVNHYLDDINETELKNLEKRDDGKFEVLDVKLDNRKTKNLDPNNKKIVENKKIDVVASNNKSTSKNLENVIVTVEDNGPGFSKGSLNKVFDRFYSDRPKNEKFGNHSGLGLSISKQIVEVHSGSIEALNRLNQKNECLGGSVKVTFPEVKN